MEISEKDWKLFRSKIGPWQEAHMERLTREYLGILQGDGLASDKFWELEKRINNDKKSPGVMIEMRRSVLYRNLACLLMAGVITSPDLEEFSEELRETLRYNFCRGIQ